MSLPITDNSYGFQIWWLLLKSHKGFLFSLAIQTLKQCNSLCEEHNTSQNFLCLRIAVNCLIELFCVSEGPSLRLTRSSRDRVMLFKLSVEMKCKTTYRHLDIASLWQIRLALFEWWLGMAGQKFMNSQCGRYGRNSGWRTILRHKARRQLVFVYVPVASWMFHPSWQ